MFIFYFYFFLVRLLTVKLVAIFQVMLRQKPTKKEYEDSTCGIWQERYINHHNEKEIDKVDKQQMW